MNRRYDLWVQMNPQNSEGSAFVLWINRKWAEYRAQTGMRSEDLTDEDHEAFDAWLQTNYAAAVCASDPSRQVLDHLQPQARTSRRMSRRRLRCTGPCVERKECVKLCK